MRKILLFFIIFLATNLALALEIPIPSPQGYVNDYAHLLQPAQIASLEEQLHAFDAKTSNQVVVATFDSLQGNPLEDFSMKIVNQWKIGSKQHDNGVLLLIIKNDKKIRIEVGYGLEGVLTDATSSEIIRNKIVPAFQQGNYFLGMQSGLTAIMQTTQDEYKTTTNTMTNFPIYSWLVLLKSHWMILIYVLIWMIFSNSKHRGSYIISSSGSLTGSGRGRSGFSGGGFGGFGGGGFGGGGASGGW